MTKKCCVAQTSACSSMQKLEIIFGKSAESRVFFTLLYLIRIFCLMSLQAVHSSAFLDSFRGILWDWNNVFLTLCQFLCQLITFCFFYDCDFLISFSSWESLFIESYDLMSGLFILKQRWVVLEFKRNFYRLFLNVSWEKLNIL